MATNIEVESKPNENPASLLRRFSKKVQQASLIPRAKSMGEHKRSLSEFEKKKNKLKKIAKKKEYERLYKLGKVGGPRYGRKR